MALDAHVCGGQAPVASDPLKSPKIGDTWCGGIFVPNENPSVFGFHLKVINPGMKTIMDNAKFNSMFLFKCIYLYKSLNRIQMLVCMCILKCK